MDIQVVSNKEEFAALRDEWNELLSRSSTKHIFLTHEWQYTWWEHFGTRDEDLLILLVRDGGRLVGIAPLRRDVLRVRGVPLLKVITFLVGCEADYRDLLLDDEHRWKIADVILTYLATEIPTWHAVILQGFRGDSATNYLLAALSAPLALRLWSSAGAVCPYIPLQGDGAETWDHYRRRGVIKEYDRKIRKARREHAVTTTGHRGGSAMEALSEFFRLHDMAWTARGGSKALFQESTLCFHRALVDRLAVSGGVFIALLQVDQSVIAARYGYVFEGTAFEYLTGYDPAYRKMSPGAALTMATADELSEIGYREMDLMRGEETYKLNFTRVARTCMTHVIYKSKHVQVFHQVVEALGGL